MKKIITKNFRETQKLGKKIAKDFQGGEIICLQGELGGGKTTFSQGLLEELGAVKPYNSPTFLIMKKYANLKKGQGKIKSAYHIDTYRVKEKDMLDLGWEEIINDAENIVIIEWPERIKKIIPTKARWVYFKWLDKDEREIKVS